MTVMSMKCYVNIYCTYSHCACCSSRYIFGGQTCIVVVSTLAPFLIAFLLSCLPPLWYLRVYHKIGFHSLIGIVPVIPMVFACHLFQFCVWRIVLKKPWGILCI